MSTKNKELTSAGATGPIVGCAIAIKAGIVGFLKLSPMTAWVSFATSFS